MLQRLYVGRLPEDTGMTKAELVSRFERFLTNNADLRIDDVQLMANSAAKDFAYPQVSFFTLTAMGDVISNMMVSAKWWCILDRISLSLYASRYLAFRGVQSALY
ncbi:hypothetical protein SPRG_16836 [Saprolegnia parasitica CBS 223.65]|uniref:Uncharacterized protein n=1 Tax=Saprolegnia parasitica (strain CBS 223.65) TaxID=695850 RepID=A0A067BLX6_SAPPC|nr:hypothetical protein SPRG_16836 [Saprolegnia parasitica CBS 223.65]KDO17725.1 hypothetical protein SPRG_16836 [Saprolegnia parasitica CBS 223.65]|eukprot:XP_012211568.1 hypothetical protein SPRG_16836 [Saprolegnia parasitica CBS 223.65]